MNNTLLEALNWRYAVKKFDSNRKIPAETWDALEQALVLSPSSYGLQPWKFIVLTDAAFREQFVPHSWGQRQVADASHLVVFAVMKKMTEEHIDSFLKETYAKTGAPAGSLDTYRQMMIGDVVTGPRSAVSMEWAARQAYIALGNFMTSAALIGIDTCPMEGFVPAEYDRILGLEAQGLTAVVACPAGYRASDDKHADRPKVRFPREQVIVHR